MRPELIGTLCAGLLLAGCAGLAPAPASRPAKPDCPPAVSVVAPPPVPPPGFTLTDLMAYAQASSQLDAKALVAEIRRMRAGGSASPVDRLKLAYLYSLGSGGADDPARARELLDGLDGAFSQAPLSQYVRDLQRLVATDLALGQERRRSAELQEKIERLKSLELQLQERGAGKAGVPR